MQKAFVRFLSMIALVILTMYVFGGNNAHADAVDDWNRSCRTKTKGPTNGWMSTSLSGPPVVTIPGNTYVKMESTGIYEVVAVNYMLSNGTRGAVYVRRSDITSACISFTTEDGERHNLNELKYYDLYGDNPPSSSGTGNNSSTTGGSTQTPTTTRPSSGKTSTQKTTKVEETPLVVTWNDQTVTVKVLGVKESQIVVENEEQTVATAELVFTTEAEADKVIAVIHAPNTGKCSLRKKASTSAAVIVKCKAGTVVNVLEYGTKFCKISYEGKLGYVLTSCLKFQEREPVLMGTGILTYNGKATGRTTINVRNSADGDSAKIAEWKTGTEVQVFALHDGWYEIEYNGIHGYVMQKFLTIEE